MLSHSPRIVTNGLILCLDAGNYKSYPRSGASIRDLSGYSNNGTITSGTFDTSGYLNFNGSTTVVDCGNAASLQITAGTISAWFFADNTNSGYNGIIAKQNAWGIFVKDNILALYDWGNNVERNSGITVGNSTWYHTALSFTETVGTPSNNAKLYLNGQEVFITTVKHNTHLEILRLGEAGASQYLSGKIAQASVYNRVLSPTEILQNFNAHRGRFGL